MTVGNGIVSGMDYGMQKNIVDQFTGDIVLVSDKQLNTSVLASMSGQTIEPIENYPLVKSALSKRSEVAQFMPAGVGYVWVLNDAGQPIDQYLLGVNMAQYNQFFPDSLITLEGRRLNPGEKGVMVPARMREWLFDYSGFWVVPQDRDVVTANLSAEAKKEGSRLDTRNQLIFLGLSQKNTSLDVLTPVTAVVKFRALNGLLGFYSIVDIESLRECMGFFPGSDAQAPLSKPVQSILESDDPEAMFDTGVSPVESQELIVDPTWFIQQKRAVSTNSDPDTGVFNLVFVKLKPGQDLDKTVQAFNASFKQNKVPVQAIPWQKATGMLGQTATIMKVALLLFVSFIFFVAIIVIMNTLSMAAMERTSEIGMMRAVGARQWFISRMFLTETLVLSMAFGGLGILVGFGVIEALALMDISTQNEMLQILYGGDTFLPRIELGMAITCLVQLGIVTLLAVIYPVFVARRITPLQAISRD